MFLKFPPGRAHSGVSSCEQSAGNSVMALPMMTALWLLCRVRG